MDVIQKTTTARSLDPKQQVAQAMLLLHNKNHTGALDVFNAASAAVAQVYDNNPDPTDEQIDSAMEQAVQAMGFVTDLASLQAQSQYLRDHHAGFYAGSFTLVDSNNDVHVLQLDADHARLLLFGVTEAFVVDSQGPNYANRQLTVDNDMVSVSLAVSVPIDESTLSDPNADVGDLARQFQVLVTGALTIKGDAVGPRAVLGKRGVATPAGVFHPTGEDPAWIWAGSYTLRFTDGDAWEDFADPMVVRYDNASQALSVNLGARRVTDIVYGNSLLSFRVELTPGTKSQVTASMQSTSGGVRKAFVWIETTGQIRALTAYCDQRLDDHALWTDPRTLGFRPSVPAPAKALPHGLHAVSRLANAQVTAADFCTTPRDACFDTAWLGAKAATTGLVGASTLFGAGFAVEDRDASGTLTGRRVMFKLTGAEALYVNPAIASLRSFQEPGADRRPQVGLDHCRVGVYIDRPLGISVDESNYAVRFSLTNPAALDDSGLDIALALDDAAHPKFELIAPNASTTTCSFTANPRKGPAPGVSTLVPDFTKASVLLVGDAGATSASKRNYVLSVTPRAAARKLSATRQPQKQLNGAWVDDGSPQSVSVPVLVGVGITKRDSTSIVRFGETPYDSLFSASGLMVPAGSGGAKAPSALFTGDSIKVGGATLTGYRVDETGPDGNPTGRIALFTAPTPDVVRFPADVKLKAFQQLDEAGLPQGGLSNARVGVLAATPFELPSLVETDFYEVRMSLLDTEALSPTGLTLELAIDDVRQPGLLSLAQPGPNDGLCPYNADDGTGPDPAVMKQVGDYTRASVLVRGATGETQNVGHKSYYISVAPKDAAGFFAVTCTIYKPDSTTGGFVVDGAATTMNVPILLRVPIEMDSRDALEASNTEWQPATRGQTYTARVTGMKGLQPFVWRLLKDDKPKGLTWDQGAEVGKDISAPGLVSFGLSGTVDGEASPGATYQPLFRLMSDRGCVMKPLLISPQLTVAEPDTQHRTTLEITNAVWGALAGLAGVAALLMGFVLWKKDVAREKKKEASDKNIHLEDMASDSLSRIGKQYGDLADAANRIYRNRDVIQRTEDALTRYEQMIPELVKKMNELEEALKTAKSDAEINRLKSELAKAKDKIEQNERERAHEKDSKDSKEQFDEISI